VGSRCRLARTTAPGLASTSSEHPQLLQLLSLICSWMFIFV